MRCWGNWSQQQKMVVLGFSRYFHCKTHIYNVICSIFSLQKSQVLMFYLYLLLWSLSFWPGLPSHKVSGCLGRRDTFKNAIFCEILRRFNISLSYLAINLMRDYSSAYKSLTLSIHNEGRNKLISELSCMFTEMSD